MSSIMRLASRIVQQYRVGAFVSAMETPLVTPRTRFARSCLANTNTVRRVPSLQGFVHAPPSRHVAYARSSLRTRHASAPRSRAAVADR